jgi:hypothetical protein
LVKSFDYPRRTGAGPSILPLHHQKYQTMSAPGTGPTGQVY